MTAAGTFIPQTQIGEMIKEQWKKIGIQADVKEHERSLFLTRTTSNQHQICMWPNDGSEVLVRPLRPEDEPLIIEMHGRHRAAPPHRCDPSRPARRRYAAARAVAPGLHREGSGRGHAILGS